MKPQEQEQEDPAKGGEDWRDVGGKILNILNNSLTRKLTISEYKKLIKLIGSLFSEIKRAKAEERQFILNVLDGIDIADAQMGVTGGTKAIRHALQARHIG